MRRTEYPINVAQRLESVVARVRQRQLEAALRGDVVGSGRYAERARRLARLAPPRKKMRPVALATC